MSGLYYEAYETMAEKMIDRLIGEARALWPVSEARVIHRIGSLAVGKLAILLAHAYGAIVSPDQLIRAGITRLQKADADYASEKHYKIKLVAKAAKLSNSG